MQPVFLDICALAESILRDSQDAIGSLLVLLGRDGGADHVIVLGEVDAAHAEGRTAHRAHVAFIEADRHAEVRGEENNLRAIGDAGGDELIFLIDANGNDAAGHDVGEILERSFLHRTLARCEEDELAFLFKVANCHDGADVFSGLQVQKTLHALALAGGADVGNLVDL